MTIFQGNSPFLGYLPTEGVPLALLQVMYANISF